MRFRVFLLFLLPIIAVLGCVFPAKALSDSQFAIDANVSYLVDTSGKTFVKHDITLENLFSNLYATSYTLSLQNINATNIKAVDSTGTELSTNVQKDGDRLDIKVSFPDSVVGKGSIRHFSISYENTSFAVKTGEVWEVSIPKLDSSNSFRNYGLSLSIPNSFGLEAYISPQPQNSKIENTNHIYTYSKDQITQTGITAGFGQFQVFSFNLSYHLENPLSKSAETQIALPPDTAFQKVYIEKLEPKPETVELDEDGNWLAIYKLNPRERMDVKVEGSVQIFAGFRPFPKPTQKTLDDNLKSTSYWQSDDPQIKSLATELKTPQAIYNYVTSTLKYDFNRVKPNVQRMGALEALKNPDQVICMEFTDLFIAIARAAGIPAREINGYAYTENPELQPLSLVADVLHAWPEYYDKNKGAWIPVDPTWGETSGVDYFNKLDLRHFAFVIHGQDSLKPYAPGSYKLGPNPQKDVFVSFGKLPEKRNSIPALSLVSKLVLPFINSEYDIKIENLGPGALYSLYPTVYFDGTEENRDYVPVLPPFSNYVTKVNLPFSVLGKTTPDKIKLVADNAQIEIPTDKSSVVIISLVSLFGAFLVIILAILFKLGKIRVNVFKKNLYKSH